MGGLNVNRFSGDKSKQAKNLAPEFAAGLVGVAQQLGPGVLAIGKSGPGVQSFSDSGSGVDTTSTTAEAVHAETQSPATAAVAAFNRNPNGTGAAIYGEKAGSNGHAGYFVGQVHVTGNITTDGDVILNNADCAEDFDLASQTSVEPGTVVVLNDVGEVMQSHQPYDKRVAGVISGAGSYRPAILLDKQTTSASRVPVALLGKVYCRVDASNGPIAAGDLLTTSSTPGHAMRLSDPVRGFGASLGKALRSHNQGSGLIPILVALQ